MRANYPKTVIEVIDPTMKFRRETLKAVNRFRASRPWHGSMQQRKRKFAWLNSTLAKAYGIPVPNLRFGRLDGSHSGRSHYIPSHHRIELVGKLSVVTFLHEFAHARGMDEREACRWSINLFRTAFPLKFSKLLFVGHTLIHPTALRKHGSQDRQV